jgi:signal transduction histidine kinase/CheY-like chemotaxis protein
MTFSKGTFSKGSLRDNKARTSFHGHQNGGSSGRWSSIRSTTSSTKSPLARSTKVTRMMWTGRVVFIFILVILAISFGLMAHFILEEGEADLAHAQFHSIADRATASSLESIERKRLGIISLASILSGSNPDSSKWPLVDLNNFETIAINLIDTSRGCHMAFAPLVTPQQLPTFEEHAYNLYQERRLPEPFPEDTALSSFGRGVFGIDSALNSTDKRYRETNGETSWGSPNKVFAPLLHHSSGPSEHLLLNLHSDQILGSMIDDIIECASEKAYSGKSLEECTVISEFSPNTTSWVPSNENVPWATMMLPVYAQNDPTTVSSFVSYSIHLPSTVVLMFVLYAQMAGVVITSLLWEDIFQRSCTDGVSGVLPVVEGGGQAYTYNFVKGKVKLLGKGDLHDAACNDYSHETILTHRDLFGPSSVPYTIAFYPTEQFFESYETANPMLASIGSVVAILVTSVMFLLYDTLVRREFFAKRDLLEAKRKFVRFVSHEVRTPLSSMSMGLTVLRGELESRFGNADSQSKAGELISLADEIAVNCHSAVDVLNDFLNYDNIETGNLTLELSVVRLFDLIEDAASEFKLVAANSNIRLVVDTPRGQGKIGPDAACFTVGDTVRITQVLRNLVSNAIQFTPDEGLVEVKATWIAASLKRKDDYKKFVLKNGEKLKVLQSGFLRLAVTDTGKGMTQLQIRNTLRKGPQLNVNGLTAGDGSGIGLWVAKGIVNGHGGTLTAASEGLGQGCCFTVSLPSYDVARAKGVRLPRESTEDAGDCLGRLKVLVVDDAKMNSKLLMRLVSKKGHTVEGAEDGEVAVDKASAAMVANADFDVILMDYQMPNMDGPTATKLLRENGCNAFIVGVTGNVMAEDVAHFKKCGANAVLHKPAKLEELENLWIESGIRGDMHETEPLEDIVTASTGRDGRNSNISSRVDMTGDVGAETCDLSIPGVAESDAASDIWKSRRYSVRSDVVDV